MRPRDVYDNTIEWNLIGVDEGGDGPMPNAADGIRFSGLGLGTISGNVISDNLISGNGANGVYLGANVTATVLTGNKIGVDQTGTAAIGNAANGILVGSGAHQNVLGGTVYADANTISGNGANGVWIKDTGSSGNSVQWNYIGLDASGTNAITNQENGIRIGPQCQLNTVVDCYVSGNRANGILVEGPGGGHRIDANIVGLNTAGNAVPNQGRAGVYLHLGTQSNLITTNVISGNANHGIEIASDQNTIDTNRIGTDTAGTTGVGNAASGIYVSGDANTISGNTICANAHYGIEAHADSVSSVTITYNRIGVGIAGGALGNDYAGVWLGKNFRNCIVGDALAPAGGHVAGGYNNLIANNGFGAGGAGHPGILVGEVGTKVLDQEPYGNIILTNSIVNNACEAIRLDYFEPGDSGNLHDLGLSAPTVDPMIVWPLITGQTNLDAANWTADVVQVFWVPTKDTCQQCEAKLFLGDAVIGAAGLWSLNYPGALSPGYIVATDTAHRVGYAGFTQTSETVCSSYFPSGWGNNNNGMAALYYARLPEGNATASHALATTGIRGSDSFISGQALDGGIWKATAWHGTWLQGPSSWMLEFLPVPGGVLDSEAEAIGRSENGSVTAVGTVADGNGVRTAVAWDWSGSHWNLLILPDLGGGSGQGRAHVAQIHDASALAAGWSTMTTDASEKPTACAWSRSGGQGSAWSIAALPDYGTEYGSEACGALEDVAHGLSLCVGWAGHDPTGSPIPTVWRRIGNDWALASLPLPAGSSRGAAEAIFSVSAPASIEVGGWYETQGGQTRGVRWSSVDGGTNWQVMDQGVYQDYGNSKVLAGASVIPQLPDPLFVGTSFDEAGNAKACGFVPGSCRDWLGFIIAPPDLNLLTATAVSFESHLLTVVGWGKAQGAQSEEAMHHAYALVGWTGTSVPDDATGESSLLARIAPNPARESTRVTFRLPEPSNVRLTVYDVSGRRIATLSPGIMQAGDHSLVWNGHDDSNREVRAGIYLVRLEIGYRSQASPVVVVR